LVLHGSSSENRSFPTNCITGCNQQHATGSASFPQRHQPTAQGEGGGLHAVADAQPQVKLAQPVGDSLGRNLQFQADLLILIAQGDKTEQDAIFGQQLRQPLLIVGKARLVAQKAAIAADNLIWIMV
jgi:hypothetical protein